MQDIFKIKIYLILLSFNRRIETEVKKLLNFR